MEMTAQESYSQQAAYLKSILQSHQIVVQKIAAKIGK
jgi:hypothetical protein